MESLNAQLKLARRESQRSDAAIRAEIEAIKRTAEKQSVADQRAKQKVLALQETVKQTIAATGELEADARAVEGDLPRVRQEEAVVEVEFATVRETADKKEAEAEEALRVDKKRISDAQAELASVNNRLEKLQAKKGKLEVETLPELEQQLAEIRQQIEALEIAMGFLTGTVGT
jgi:chromosome segregation ATPase